MPLAEVSFKASQADTQLAKAIAARAADLTGRDPIEIKMDLLATHANGCRLDFVKLSEFDTFNLLHDINGIDRHLDRDTGKLKDCFLPRAYRG